MRLLLALLIALASAQPALAQTGAEMDSVGAALIRQAEAEQDTNKVRELSIAAIALFDGAIRGGITPGPSLERAVELKYSGDLLKDDLGTLVVDYVRDRPRRREPAVKALAGWLDPIAAESNEANRYFPFKRRAAEIWNRVLAAPEPSHEAGKQLISRAVCMAALKHNIPQAAFAEWQIAEPCVAAKP
jgi:hypothetical protein